jgi:hypothetical protein
MPKATWHIRFEIFFSQLLITDQVRASYHLHMDKTEIVTVSCLELLVWFALGTHSRSTY